MQFTFCIGNCVLRFSLFLKLQNGISVLSVEFFKS